MRFVGRIVPGMCVIALLWAGIAASAVAAPPLQGEQVEHVVQAGETLSAIAQHYGITVEAIIATNELADPDRIQVGQRLIIPGAAPSAASTTVYVVQLGDTLALVSRRYGVPVQDLAQLNHLANPNLIYVGQRLLIPSAQGGESFPAGGEVYIVRAGDTIANLAARYGTTVWAVAQANSLANPNVIHVGQRLFIPSGASQSSLPLPFVAVNIVPAVVRQGQTVQIIVETQGDVDLSGSFDQGSLVFVGGDGQYRALAGIPAMALPGPYALDLKAVQAGQAVSIHSMVQVTAGDFGAQDIALSDEKSELLDPELVNAEAERLWQVTTQITLPGLWQGMFRLPLAEEAGITAPFGIRRSYNGGPVTSFHAGIDYDAAEGTPVYCPARGRVVLAAPLQVRGNAVVIDHGRGVMSGYWHLSQIDVTVGQAVEPGDVLGLVGTTGLSTGPHLHWELRVVGIQVDPLQWARETIQ
jgi:murein DD-endopeptidase MepM/ murein hydrolase activator NlpD